MRGDERKGVRGGEGGEAEQCPPPSLSLKSAQGSVTCHYCRAPGQEMRLQQRERAPWQEMPLPKQHGAPWQEMRLPQRHCAPWLEMRAIMRLQQRDRAPWQEMPRPKRHGHGTPWQEMLGWRLSGTGLQLLQRFRCIYLACFLSGLNRYCCSRCACPLFAHQPGNGALRVVFLNPIGLATDDATVTVVLEMSLLRHM